MYWMEEWTANLAVSGPVVAAMTAWALIIQLTPVVIYGLASPKVSSRVRAVSLALSVLFGLFSWLQPQHGQTWAVSGLGLLYYTGLGFLVYLAEPRVASGLISRDALAVLTFSFCLLLPSFLFRRLGIVPLLVFGWSFMLATYSYCLDARQEGVRPTAKQAMFFLMIDRSLVFPLRGHTVASGDLRQGGRAVLGIIMSVAGNTFLDRVGDFGSLMRFDEREPWKISTIGLLLLVAACGGVAMYWVRAGAVHAHIGLLAFAGVQVRESFDRPYLASSPLDFWRRWNSWVGDWARRYIFMPVTLRLRRFPSVTLSTWATAIGVLTTFSVVGALHDLLTFLGELTPGFAYLRMFVFSALILVFWEGAKVRLASLISTSRTFESGMAAGRHVMLVLYLLSMLRVVGIV